MAQKDRLTQGVVTCATPVLTIGGLTALSAPPGVTLDKARSASVDVEHAAVMSARPSIRFSSLSIADVLASCGVSGLECTTLKAIFQRLVPYGTRSSANAQSISLAKAYMLPRTIQASQEAPATIDVEAFAISTDGADPTTLSAADTLPAGAGASEVFTMGPVNINGVSYDLESGSLDFGIAEQVEASEGHAFAEQAWIETRDATFTLASRTAYTLNDLGIVGEELTAFSWYLRKLEEYGTRVANGTSEHVKFTCTGYVHVDDVSADPNTRMNTAIMVTPVGAITIDETSAIT